MWQDVETWRRQMRPERWARRWRAPGFGLRRWVSVVVVTAIVASVVTGALWPTATQASLTNVLYNGGFEQGFNSQAGCGAVGSGWQCFTNGGAANYGFYDDEWERVVSEGGHSQLIEVNTKGIMAGDADRYAGIYQTVPVVSWAEYMLSLKGIIRTTSQEGDPWRYRVQVGWSFGAYPDWTKVTNWQDVGWDKYYLRTEPGSFSSFLTKFRAEAEYVTVYIRVWKKWGVSNEELDVNFDAIALTGPSGPWQGAQPYADGYSDPGYSDPGYSAPPMAGGYGDPGYGDPGYGAPPMAGGYSDPGYGDPGYGAPVVDPVHPIYPPVVDPVHPIYPPPPGACVGPNLVYNGDFERGFNAVAVGKVGNSWGYFTNGGGANYGFYDDEWPRVRSDGAHSQLIEINTKNSYPVDNDRYAGIYQYITGLHPGVTYEFAMYGLLRGEGNEDDPYRFAAQWGYAPGYNATWQAVANWTEMNFGPISKRTEPAALVKYTAKFVAQTSDITLYIRGWKKWGVPQVEMDFNIDGVMVTACGGYGGPVPPTTPPVVDGCWSAPDCGGMWLPPVVDGCGSAPDCGVVQPPVVEWPGNGCGQAPDCGGGWWGDGCTVVVQPGDTLASIAWQRGVSLHELIAVNAIYNPDLIFVGQTLTLPGCGAPVPPVDPAPGQHYTVQPGDTLSQIAAWYGVSVQLLCEVNGLWDANMIYVGQVLIIP